MVITTIPEIQQGLHVHNYEGNDDANDKDDD